MRFKINVSTERFACNMSCVIVRAVVFIISMIDFNNLCCKEEFHSIIHCHSAVQVPREAWEQASMSVYHLQTKKNWEISFGLKCIW